MFGVLTRPYLLFPRNVASTPLTHWTTSSDLSFRLPLGIHPLQAPEDCSPHSRVLINAFENACFQWTFAAVERDQYVVDRFTYSRLPQLGRRSFSTILTTVPYMVQRELTFEAGADYPTAINYALVYEDEVALQSLSSSVNHVEARIDDLLWLL